MGEAAYIAVMVVGVATIVILTLEGLRSLLRWWLQPWQPPGLGKIADTLENMNGCSAAKRGKPAPNTESTSMRRSDI